MYASRHERLASGLAAAAIVSGGVAILMSGLAGRASEHAPKNDALTVIAVQPEPSPTPDPPTPPPKGRSTAAKEAPSPPALRNRATPVVAPRLPPLIKPPPVIAAPRPADGAAWNSGAADRPGPGQGAGGFGSGTGGGGTGDGDGEADGVTAPRHIRGKLRFSDLPASMQDNRQGGALSVRYRVGTDGRVTNCAITRPSGYPELDRRACALIEKRFRYRPSLNAQGQPVPATVTENHEWFYPPENSGHD